MAQNADFSSPCRKGAGYAREAVVVPTPCRAPVRRLVLGSPEASPGFDSPSDPFAARKTLERTPQQSTSRQGTEELPLMVEAAVQTEFSDEIDMHSSVRDDGRTKPQARSSHAYVGTVMSWIIRTAVVTALLWPWATMPQETPVTEVMKGQRLMDTSSQALEVNSRSDQGSASRGLSPMIATTVQGSVLHDLQPGATSCLDDNLDAFPSHDGVPTSGANDDDLAMEHLMPAGFSVGDVAAAPALTNKHSVEEATKMLQHSVVKDGGSTAPSVALSASHESLAGNVQPEHWFHKLTISSVVALKCLRIGLHLSV
jgi:hypothetical protein